MKVHEIKNLFLTADFRQVRVHVGSMCNDTLRDFTLIKMTAARFVGKECFLIRYSVIQNGSITNKPFKEET